VPSPLSPYVVRELAPASPEASLPCGVNVNANGTGVAELLTTGVVESVPSRRTRNTSILLPLIFVVTSSWRPFGLKPT
jgi:hypothetical protein